MAATLLALTTLPLAQSQVLALKYQLPSDPSVYVDVVDDEDVALMLDEWHEAAAAAGPSSNPYRLHIFVQWCVSFSSCRLVEMVSLATFSCSK